MLTLTGLHCSGSRVASEKPEAWLKALGNNNQLYLVPRSRLKSRGSLAVVLLWAMTSLHPIRSVYKVVELFIVIIQNDLHMNVHAQGVHE